MSNMITKVAIFSAGAALGAVSAWMLLKNYYEKISREEIESVKYEYSKDREPTEFEKEETSEERVEFLNKTRDILGQYGYNEIPETEENTEKGEPEPKYEIAEIIPPDEFGELESYDIYSLRYWDDGVLTDDQNHIIEDDIGFVGIEFEDSFGEWEDDSVYVRNDESECYFEILKDERPFHGTVPMEDE